MVKPFACRFKLNGLLIPLRSDANASVAIPRDDRSRTALDVAAR
jgi:hypothetical protein